jgi:acyl CoA:acetate/3-ketoacid CoA transferase alpha subunit
MAPRNETREFDGVTYVLERAIRTDFALVHAWTGDRHGNLIYREAAANFNPDCVQAGRITIAEVEHLVSPERSIPLRCTPRISTFSGSCTCPIRTSGSRR